MYDGRILFAQLIDFLPHKAFNRCVKKYNGDSYCKNFSCRDQFLAMAFAQITNREGLRGIQETLRANSHCLYHMGFRCKTISRNTLAHANQERPWQIYAEFAAVLMKRARQLYQGEELAADLDAAVFALDSTTIDLCLARFPWAPFQPSKAAVKMHVLLNLRGNIPDFLVISDGRTHDVNILDTLRFEPGAYYIMDRGYLSFKRLYAMHKSRAFFVTLEKTNLSFAVCKSNPVDKKTGLRCDQTIRLPTKSGRKYYPERLRRVKYHDAETGNVLTFYTNDFDLPPLIIAELYRQRWQVELFFKWLKQHLRIKTFYGYSENAVRIQFWIAVSVYCLLAIIRKEVGADREMHEIQEILSASIFQKMPLLQAFSRKKPKVSENAPYKQLVLF